MGVIDPPAPLWSHRGVIKVFFFVDDQKICHSQPVGDISIPKLPLFPRIVCQAYNSGNRPVGPAFTYNPDGDNGNGDWDTFNPDIHLIPITTPVVEGTPPEEATTELSGSVAPMSVPPSVPDVVAECPPAGVAQKKRQGQSWQPNSN